MPGPSNIRPFDESKPFVNTKREPHAPVCPDCDSIHTYLVAEEPRANLYSCNDCGNAWYEDQNA